MNALRLGLRNVIKNQRRSTLTLVAIAVGLAAVNIFQGYVRDTLQSLERTAIFGEALGHLVVYKKDALLKGQMDEARYMLSGDELKSVQESLASLPEVDLIVPKLELSGLITNGRRSLIFVGQGVDPEKYRALRRGFDFHGAGQMIDPLAPGGGQIGSDLAKLLETGVGETMVLFSTTLQYRMNAVDMEVRGIYDTGVRTTNDKTVLVPLKLAQKLYGTHGVSYVAVLLKDGRNLEPARQRVAAALAGGGLDVEIFDWRQMSLFYRNVSNLFRTIFLALFLIVVVVVVMGILNTMNMSVLERTKEIGALRALGLHRLGVVRIFCSEALVLSAIGAAAGTALSVAIAQVINAAGVAYVPPGFSQTVYLEVALRTKSLLLNGALFLVLAVAAAFPPAYAAARRRVADALRAT